MRDTLIVYVIALLIMAALDFSWLSLTSQPLYHRELGPMLADRPNLAAATAFYLLYAFGVVVLAIQPALANGDWKTAMVRGAVLGLVAYGTYDLTNMATLKQWSVKITLIDMAWGSFVTAVTASTATVLALAWQS